MGVTRSRRKRRRGCQRSQAVWSVSQNSASMRVNALDRPISIVKVTGDNLVPGAASDNWTNGGL
jgi:hypothetical protein